MGGSPVTIDAEGDFTGDGHDRRVEAGADVQGAGGIGGQAGHDIAGDGQDAGAGEVVGAVARRLVTEDQVPGDVVGGIGVVEDARAGVTNNEVVDHHAAGEIDDTEAAGLAAQREMAKAGGPRRLAESAKPLCADRHATGGAERQRRDEGHSRAGAAGVVNHQRCQRRGSGIVEGNGPRAGPDQAGRLPGGWDRTGGPVAGIRPGGRVRPASGIVCRRDDDHGGLGGNSQTQKTDQRYARQKFRFH